MAPNLFINILRLSIYQSKRWVAGCLGSIEKILVKKQKTWDDNMLPLPLEVFYASQD